MLVLLGPPFAGSDEDYSRLARATGLLPYDLRAKLRPGGWGVVRAIADRAAAEKLAAELVQLGYRAAAVPPDVAQDPGRKIVELSRLDFGDQLSLHLRGREMPIDYRALLTIVQGEARIADLMARSRSSASFRAVSPSAAEMESFRDAMTTSQFESFLVADLHFVTVPWVARIDSRHFEFTRLGVATGTRQGDLAGVTRMILERCDVLVDTHAKTSSVGSFVEQRGPKPMSAPGAPAPSLRDEPTDERLDGYSRLIGEAERLTRRLRRGGAVSSLAPRPTD